MAVRTQVYQGLLWQQVIREQELKSRARLPPLLLLVLHSGARRWRAPTEITELIRLEPDSRLWYWQPQLRYHLLDVRAFAKKALQRPDSLVALLFRLERPWSLRQLERLIEEIIGWFHRHKGFQELKCLFKEIVRQAVRSTGLRVRASEGLSEMRCNVAAMGQRLRAQLQAKGKAIGRAEGKAEGRAEGLVIGKAQTLVCLLISRFGALPPSLRKRIRGAKLASIERWFNRALEAHDLSSVFDR